MKEFYKMLNGQKLSFSESHKVLNEINLVPVVNLNSLVYSHYYNKLLLAGGEIDGMKVSLLGISVDNNYFTVKDFNINNSLYVGRVDVNDMGQIEVLYDNEKSGCFVATFNPETNQLIQLKAYKGYYS